MSACKSQLTPTKTLNSDNNRFVKMLLEDFSHCALDEERAPKFKGKWAKFYKSHSSEALGVEGNSLENLSGGGAIEQDRPSAKAATSSEFKTVDLEIGTGNGLHFAHRANTNPDRLLLGIEIKFKPLIQSIRRAYKYSEVKNSIMMRYNAYNIEELFHEGELTDIFIHHPDPWPKKKQIKHRLLQPEYLDKLYSIQKNNGILDFKTDSADYFEWVTPILKSSKYKIIKFTKDLHNSEFAEGNFETHFEKIFLKKGQPIFYAQMLRI